MYPDPVLRTPWRIVRFHLPRPGELLTHPQQDFAEFRTHFGMLQAIRNRGLQETCLASAIVMLSLISIGHYRLQLKKPRDAVRKLNLAPHARFQGCNAIEYSGRQYVTPYNCQRGWRRLRCRLLHDTCEFSCCGFPDLHWRHRQSRSGVSARAKPSEPPQGCCGICSYSEIICGKRRRLPIDQVVGKQDSERFVTHQMSRALDRMPQPSRLFLPDKTKTHSDGGSVAEHPQRSMFPLRCQFTFQLH